MKIDKTEKFWLVPTDLDVYVSLLDDIEAAQKYAEELIEEYAGEKFYIISNLTNKVVLVGTPRKQVTRVEWSGV